MNEPTLLRLVALVALVGTYLGLGLGHVPGLRLDRTGIAIVGATVMVVGGVIRWDRAVAAVDAHTLVLLFGMMVVTVYLRLSGFFALVTAWTIRRTTTPAGLLAALVVTSGVLSALFVNDVVCLVLAPLILEVTRQLDLPPRAYLIALATSSNVVAWQRSWATPRTCWSGVSRASATGASWSDRRRWRSSGWHVCSPRCGSPIVGSSRASFAPRHVASGSPCTIRS